MDRAEAYEALGATDRARQLYARYLAATGNADAELRASPDHARERLNHLAGAAR